MDPFIIFMTILLALALIGFLMERKVKKKGKEYGAIKYGIGTHMYGLPIVRERPLAHLFCTEDKIIIEVDKRNFELMYEQLTAAEAMPKTSLLTKDKSVIARGVVGDVLIGPLGAILGGMSGVGQKKMIGNFLVLSYIPSNSNETKFLIFNMRSFSMAQKLAKFIRTKTPQQKAAQL